MVDMEWPGPRQPDVPFLEVDILSKLLTESIILFFCSATCLFSCMAYL